MKRIIVDYTKLSKEILDILSQKYPIGFPKNDIISFKNAKGETIEAVEIQTDEAIYMVKLGVKLNRALKNHLEDYYDDLDDDSDDINSNNIEVAPNDLDMEE